MATASINLTVQPSTFNKPGTILLLLSGPMAYEVPIEVLVKEIEVNFGISWDQIEALYNLESPTRWFLNLEEKAKEQHYAGLHNAEIGDLDTHGFVGLLVHEDKMDVKIYLNWVPTMIGGDGVVEIAQYLALPGTPIKVSQHPYNASKWALYLTPGREIPHYLLVNAGVFKRQKIWVQIPGRRAKCFHCESTQHWSNQCSKKKGQAAKPANPTAPTTKPESAPTKSYAVATSGKPAATSSPVRPPPPPTSTSPSTDRKRKTQEGKRTKKVEAEGKKEQKKAHNRTESSREAEREEVAEKENQEDDGFQMVARRRSRSSSPAKSSFKRQGSSGILMEQTRRKLLRSDLNRSFNQQF